MMNKFTLQGNPISQARPRIFRRGGKTMCFNPQAGEKLECQREAREQAPDIQHMKYPRMRFWFFMSIPKSMRKSDRMYAEKEMLRHVVKPDIDNLLKFYLDVLSGILYEDDACVEISMARKVYSPNPRTVIFADDASSQILPQSSLYE